MPDHTPGSTEDEEYIVGRTPAELRAYFDDAKVQSFRENGYWRLPGNVPFLYALDFIEALERECSTLLRERRAAIAKAKGTGG